MNDNFIELEQEEGGLPELDLQIQLTLESDRLQAGILKLKEELSKLQVKKALIDAQKTKLEEENVGLYDFDTGKFGYRGLNFIFSRGSTYVEVDESLDTSKLPEKYLNPPVVRTVNKNFFKSRKPHLVQSELGELANLIRVERKPDRLVFKMGESKSD